MSTEITAPENREKKKLFNKIPVEWAITAGAIITFIVLAVIIFSAMSVSEKKAVEKWTEEWNSAEFSENCRCTVYSSYTASVRMRTLFNRDTDHVLLTKKDIRSLKKGRSVGAFDDFTKLTLKAQGGKIKEAKLTIDYGALCEYYHGEDYSFDSFRYCSELFDDSTIRTLGYIGMFMNPMNDSVNSEGEMLNSAIELYLADGRGYHVDKDINRIDMEDCSYTLEYSTSYIDIFDQEITGISKEALLVTVTAKYK